jgi:hypothetical protein
MVMISYGSACFVSTILLIQQLNRAESVPASLSALKLLPSGEAKS